MNKFKNYFNLSLLILTLDPLSSKRKKNVHFKVEFLEAADAFVLMIPESAITQDYTVTKL